MTTEQAVYFRKDGKAIAPICQGELAGELVRLSRTRTRPSAQRPTRPQGALLLRFAQGQACAPTRRAALDRATAGRPYNGVRGQGRETERGGTAGGRENGAESPSDPRASFGGRTMRLRLRRIPSLALEGRLRAGMAGYAPLRGLPGGSGRFARARIDQPRLGGAGGSTVLTQTVSQE